MGACWLLHVAENTAHSLVAVCALCHDAAVFVGSVAALMTVWLGWQVGGYGREDEGNMGLRDSG
jgi:hypothetical protein